MFTERVFLFQKTEVHLHAFGLTDVLQQLPLLCGARAGRLHG